MYEHACQLCQSTAVHEGVGRVTPLFLASLFWLGESVAACYMHAAADAAPVAAASYSSTQY